MATKKPVAEFPFSLIERRFSLAPLTFGGFSPAVSRDEDGTYSIRVLLGSAWSGEGTIKETYSYFRCAPDGTITEAPRGFAKDYRPGRITGLDEAVDRYARMRGH